MHLQQQHHQPPPRLLLLPLVPTLWRYQTTTKQRVDALSHLTPFHPAQPQRRLPLQQPIHAAPNGAIHLGRNRIPHIVHKTDQNRIMIAPPRIDNRTLDPEDSLKSGELLLEEMRVVEGRSGEDDDELEPGAFVWRVRGRGSKVGYERCFGWWLR